MEKTLNLEQFIKKNIDRYVKSRWKSASVEGNLETMAHDDLQCIIIDYINYQDEQEDAK